jgi:hypothetical protein
MEQSEYQTDFSKALLTGLFMGVASTLICLVFALIYRTTTGYSQFVINFPTIIFGCNIILTVIGIIYFYFRKFIKKSNLVFIAVFLLLTIFCIVKVQGIKHSGIGLDNDLFRNFFSGLIIILCLSALLIPLLYGNKKFLDTFI